MTNDRYHVINRGRTWVIKREGSSRATKTFSTKAEAQTAAKEYREQNYDVVIHNADGTVSAWLGAA